MGRYVFGAALAAALLLTTSGLVDAQVSPACHYFPTDVLAQNVGLEVPRDVNSCVLDDGTVNLIVHFQVPPTQAHINHLAAQMQGASQILCDATDGQIRLGKITLTHGAYHEEKADLRWYAATGRANTALGLDRGQTKVYGYGLDPSVAGATSATAHVLAHELGHYILELGDQYPSENGGCDRGPGFDNDRGDMSWAVRNNPQAMTAAQRAAATADTDVERNHTIMQESGLQVCRDSTDNFRSAFDKHPEYIDRGTNPCFTDAAALKTSTTS